MENLNPTQNGKLLGLKVGYKLLNTLESATHKRLMKNANWNKNFRMGEDTAKRLTERLKNQIGQMIVGREFSRGLAGQMLAELSEFVYARAGLKLGAKDKKGIIKDGLDPRDFVLFEKLVYAYEKYLEETYYSAWIEWGNKYPKERHDLTELGYTLVSYHTLRYGFIHPGKNKIFQHLLDTKKPEFFSSGYPRDMVCYDALSTLVDGVLTTKDEHISTHIFETVEDAKKSLGRSGYRVYSLKSGKVLRLIDTAPGVGAR
ncbi:MAG: hypothetical protein IE936_09630 [Moraxella osloensis]|nr:hypothetical protein [Moraxella osloensis]